LMRWLSESGMALSKTVVDGVGNSYATEQKKKKKSRRKHVRNTKKETKIARDKSENFPNSSQQPLCSRCDLSMYNRCIFLMEY
jgi:hypothetical protein